MRKMGLEPTRHECHKILSLARLPVPTLPHFVYFSILTVFSTADRKINFTINIHKCQQFFLTVRSLLLFERRLPDICQQSTNSIGRHPLSQLLRAAAFSRTAFYSYTFNSIIPYSRGTLEFRQIRLSDLHP